MFGFDQVEVKKSYSPIKPGREVAIKLKEVKLSEKGDLDFYIEGTDPSNAGSYKPRFWVSDFTKEGNERYDAKVAEDKMVQLKRLLQAYLTPEQISEIKGNSVQEWYGAIAQAMNPGVTANVDATMKIVLKWNSDTDCEIPRYGDYISTPLQPRGLALNSKLNNKGLPFDRVLPMAEYGVTADGGAPTAPASTTFGSTTAPVPGGPSDSDMPF